MKTSRSGATVMPIRKLRMAKGWSLDRLSGISGVGRHRIRQLEHNQVDKYMSIQIRDLCRLSIALECAPSDILPFLTARPTRTHAKRIAAGAVIENVNSTLKKKRDEKLGTVARPATGEMPESLEETIHGTE